MPDEDAKVRAARDLKSIRAIKDCPEFESYYLRRLRAKIEDLEAKALSVDTPKDETEILKNVAAGLKKHALNLLDDDTAGCRRVIGG